MRLFTKKSLIRRVSALALCMAIGMSHASAYGETDAALDSLPAADTNAAAIGMISTTSSTTVGSVHTTEEMSKAKADVRDELSSKALFLSAGDPVYEPDHGKARS